MTEEFVKNSIIKYLSRKEWGTNLHFGSLRERGVDIKVRHNRYSRYFLIECKGQGVGRGSSEVAFIYSLGQIISRMKSGGTTRYYYGLGLPEKSAKIALRRLPWQVAKKLLLYVFSVDLNGVVAKYAWQDLKKVQELKK
ncbi:MAG: hypothetical protein UX31_C0027G0006 [Candidatus Nomurabacteria bacterium GW2011_GWA1_46_11]|uniref:Restriction endonuclease type IV Mrr domain-containing protein n=1 Tax=Candidatus Nomurabacteria bacterium GW2011_GWA1_46_11 TaxID=1618732 RepID=A0A0G1QST5_9BACT|nr:MAG: hypothetical protein UX31_C0027G0006 [Candidatus Nomurabacteria bacterium GW2011_GWA1_46_11]